MSLLLSLALMLSPIALAETGGDTADTADTADSDSGDTGDSTDSDTDTDSGEDSDSGDTADTATTTTGVGAAALSGEEGGFGCSAVPGAAGAGLALLGFGLALRRRKD